MKSVFSSGESRVSHRLVCGCGLDKGELGCAAPRTLPPVMQGPKDQFPIPRTWVLRSILRVLICESPLIIKIWGPKCIVENAVKRVNCREVMDTWGPIYFGTGCITNFFES